MKNLYRKVWYSILLSLSFIAVKAYSADLKFITLEVAPWAYSGESGDGYIGVFPELVKELEKRTGHSISITLAPYARINRELEAARQDCTMLISDSERDRITVKGELVFNHPMGVVARKTLDIDTYNDLYGIKISLLRGSIISEKFNTDDKLDKDFDTDYQISLQKMKYGRLDAIAGAIPTIQYLAKKNGLHHMLGKPLQLSSEPIYLQCAKESTNIKYIDDLNKAIRSIKSDSSLDLILGRNS